MFIQTEATPNPQVLKFLPGRQLLPGGSREFVDRAEARGLAAGPRALLHRGVTRVYFGDEFLTVTKDADSDWAYLKAPILAEIMDHFTSGAPLIVGEEAAADEEVYEGETAQIVAEIKDLIDTRIRPAVAQDGGDILFSRFEPDTGVVWLQHARRLLRLPVLGRHPEVRRREPAAPLRARGHPGGADARLSDRARHRHLPRRLPGRPLRGRPDAGRRVASRWSAATRSGWRRWRPR